MEHHIEKVRAIIEPLRQEIINYQFYSVIKDAEDLSIFLQYHVYAVWDLNVFAQSFTDLAFLYRRSLVPNRFYRHPVPDQ